MNKIKHGIMAIIHLFASVGFLGLGVLSFNNSNFALSMFYPFCSGMFLMLSLWEFSQQFMDELKDIFNGATDE